MNTVQGFQWKDKITGDKDRIYLELEVIVCPVCNVQVCVYIGKPLDRYAIPLKLSTDVF